MDELISIDELCRGLIQRDNQVDVYREGRGRLGRFISAKPANRVIRGADGKPSFDKHTDFWSIAYAQPSYGIGAETVIKSAYLSLKLEKVDGVYRLIIPA